MAIGPTIYRRPKTSFILNKPKGGDKVKWEKHRKKKNLPIKIK